MENQHLTVGDYVQRSCIFFGLFVFIQFIQLPLLVIKTTNSLVVNLLILVLYFGLYAIAIGIAWHFYKQYHPEPVQKINGNGVAIVISGYVGFMIYQMVMLYFSRLVFNQAQSSNNEAIIKLLSSNSIVLVAMLVGIIILSPILEELIFRGLIVDGLFKGRPVIWPMLVSGLLFGMAHGFSNIFTFMIYAGLGAGLVFVYHKTRTIQANILLHVINNSIASIGLLTLILK
ncbi:CPBP family intramembrane glutamic endopeptidase [Lactobacillaceae bacterium Scapto_B20]